MAQAVAMADMFQKTDTATFTNVCPMCGKQEQYTLEIPDMLKNVLVNRDTTCFCAQCKVVKEKEEKAQREKEAKELAIKQSAIPQEFCQWDVAKGNNVLARKIRDSRFSSIFVSGKNNCGKTRCSAYNLMVEAKSGYECRFIRFSDLAAEYSSICKTQSENSMRFIRGVFTNDIVLIDDIAKRRITETAGEMLYDIFDLLYSGEYKTRIWVTSNLSLTDLASAFANADIGDAVVSRIDRMIEDNKMIKIEL